MLANIYMQAFSIDWAKTHFLVILALFMQAFSIDWTFFKF